MQVRVRPADHLRALLAEPSRKEIGKSLGHVRSGFVVARELATPAGIACCEAADGWFAIIGWVGILLMGVWWFNQLSLVELARLSGYKTP